MSEGFKIHPQPEYDALNAFDAENHVEPTRVIAERIVEGYGLIPLVAQSMVDEISGAIEDARDLGVRRGPLIPPVRQRAVSDDR